MPEINNIPDIEDLLNELERLAPTRASGEDERTVVYRTVDDHEPINDAIDDDDADLQDWIDWQQRQELPFVWDIDTEQIPANPLPIVAVDTGVVRLGETEDGLIIALRGTIVNIVNSHPVLNLYRTGPIYLRNSDKLPILHVLGVHLGKPDIFVELDGNEQPIRVKSGVADNIQAYSDRFRNWFELYVVKQFGQKRVGKKRDFLPVYTA